MVERLEETQENKKLAEMTHEQLIAEVLKLRGENKHLRKQNCDLQELYVDLRTQFENTTATLARVSQLIYRL